MLWKIAARTRWICPYYVGRTEKSLSRVMERMRIYNPWYFVYGLFVHEKFVTSSTMIPFRIKSAAVTPVKYFEFL